MGTLIHSESRRLYSWWWDSHISPKNSKWLQENLTDMDAKVKSMIKLIEEDADSFAKRAEMYYKKRPELIKLVEEFYRAYRALAERYDHATGALHQAHRTMSEAFPSQVPFDLLEDLPSGSSAGDTGPHTPDMPHPTRALFDPDDLHKDALGPSSSQFHAAISKLAFADETKFLSSKKGLKQLNEMFGSEEGSSHHAKFAPGRVKKGINFRTDDVKSSSDYTADSKTQSLTEALAKLEAETEERLRQYQQSLQRLGDLETEVSRAQEDSKELDERASKAESEVQTLKQSLSILEDEKEAGLLQYKQCLERISNLENKISLVEEDSERYQERAGKTETEVQFLKQSLAKQEAEKESILFQYRQSLERIANMEMEISRAKENAEGLSSRATKAETEAQTLREILVRLESEKEAGLVQYKMSLETITDLETRVSQAEKDAQGLHERASKAETEAQILQEALVELQSENEAGLLQYKQCLDKISDLDSKVSLAEEEAEELQVRASDAETEAQNLKEFLARLESEKEAGLVQYNQCLETISNLEREVSRAEEDAREFHDRACKAETEAQTLQETLSILESEKETGLLQSKLCQETICNLETKISHAEEVAERLHERAEKAESNVKSLEQLIATLHEEKANAALEYQNCLKTVANLETELSVAQEEVKNLNSEIEKGVAKLKNSEEHNFLLERDNQSLQADIASLVQKTENQRHKLLEKHEELEKLWCSLQEESFRSMQVEASFHTLKDLHFHSLEERKSLAMELQKGVLMLKGMELSNQNLERELHQVKEENDELNEQNSSYAMSTKSMKAEIFNMRGTIGKREEEGRLLVDQKHALQQELYCLKEDIENLDRRYQGVIEQVNSVGLNPDCLWSTVKGLQVENSNLKDTIEKDNDEKIALLGKLKNMEKLMQKNTFLENSLSEINAEIERLRMKVEALESSHSSLDEEKSFLLAQKSTLVSQLEIVTVKMEKLSKENDLLENSISDKNDEVEALRRKLNFFEESYWSLENEKSCISTERDILLSNLEGIEKRLEVLQTKYAELEEKYSNLEKEKAFTSRQVKELKYSLDSEKQEHANFIRSSEIKLAHFEDQIYYLQEESRRMQKEFEEEQDKAIESQVEIFIMHRLIKDMAEKNLSLMIKCHKYFQASKKSETSISELELKLFEQQVESNTSLNKLEGLRMALHEILKSLEIEPDYEIKDDKMLMQHILHTIEDIRSSLLTSQDENQKLLFEKLILVTFLERLRVEASEIECANNNLDQKFKIRSEELMLLQREKQELLDTNEQLRLDVKSGEQREEVLKAEVENLYGTLSDLKESNCVLEYENYKVKEEKKSLTKECSVLKEENFVLQEENGIILGEVVTLGNISLILKSYCTEKSWEIEVLGKNMDGLHGVKGDLEKEVTTSGKKLEIVEMENIHLKSSVVKLEDELNTAREMNDQVICLLEKEKDMLSRKELELSEAEHKLKAMQSETEELRGDMIRLKMDNDEARVIREELEKQNLKELEDNTRLTKEIRFRKEAHEESESELLKLQEEIKDCKLREKKLSFELEKEVQLQEVDAATLYTDLQMSTICSHLFKSKVLEVVVSCKNLEDENTSKEAEIRQLRERLSGLEGESEVLKLKLAAYLPVMDSLKDNIISLEGHLLPETATQEGVNQDGELSIHMHEKSFQEPKQEQSKSVTDGVSYLQELQSRVKSVEKELMEMGKLRDKERLDNSIRPDVAMKENEDLKSKTSNVQEEEVQMIRNTSSMEKEELGTDPRNLQVQKTDSEISEKGDEIPVKDIPLDQISECSSCDRGFGSRGISRRVNSEIDDQMLELWGTSGSIELMINMPDLSENPESELEAEKELRKDKLEISKRRTEPNQEANKRKFLERLASDGQKLSELQITIQNLRKDVEKSKKNKKTKSIEYNNIKQQIKDFEETLVQLVDGTGNLIKKAEEGCLPSRRSDPDEFEANAKGWRRILEQAKEGSEKIGRLELELKEIQSVLLKLGTQNGNKGINGANKNPGILLRDYIYGGVRGSSNQSKKKLSFFACIRRPSTKEE